MSKHRPNQFEESSPIGPIRTQEEVGQIMGITSHRVRQIEAQAKKKLRIALEQIAAEKDTP
jgi:DNA-directed RNA polymerase sigma subunit (sigma70/sigma32)